MHHTQVPVRVNQVGAHPGGDECDNNVMARKETSGRERAKARAKLPSCHSPFSLCIAETHCAATGFDSGSQGARTPNLRIKSLPDHTAEKRISSDCNGFQPTQTIPEAPRPVKKGLLPRALKGQVGAPNAR